MTFTLTVAGLEWIQALLVKEDDLAGLTVHLKIDSGMGRIGFREAGEVEQAQALLQQHGVHVEGILPTLLLLMKNQMTTLMPS